MKLSIITINHNNCEGLRKTIDSVINQTWQDFEWIIVDGGSTDGSKELIEETVHQLAPEGWNTSNFSLSGFTAEDWKNGTYPKPAPREACPRTLLWTSEKDHGIYNAMNKGIVMAEGDYCLFLNSGDWLYEGGVLGTVMAHISTPIDFYVGRIQTNRGITSGFGSYYSLNHLKNCSFPHQASFISYKVFEKFGLYNESYKVVSDWELFIKALVHGTASIQFIDIIVSNMQDGGVSNDPDKLAVEKSIISQSYFSDQLSLDLVRSQSLADVLSASVVTRILYSILYRLAMFLK